MTFQYPLLPSAFSTVPAEGLQNLVRTRYDAAIVAVARVAIVLGWLEQILRCNRE